MRSYYASGPISERKILPQGEEWGEGDELGLSLFNNVHIEILLYRDFSRSALRFFTVRPFGRIIIIFTLLAPVGPTWRMRNAR